MKSDILEIDEFPRATVRAAGVEPDEQSGPRKRSSINIPLNLDKLARLPEPIRDDVTWFHSYCSAQGYTKEDCVEAISYSWPNIFKLFHGEYEGSLENVCRAIRSFRKTILARSKIQNAEFVPNRNSQLIFNALDYALHANVIALILGETGLSKSISLPVWRDKNNHGKTTLIELAPGATSSRRIARSVCEGIGASIGKNTDAMWEAIYKAFNPNRMLIIDEAHFLFPHSQSNPIPLEALRRLHDRRKCAIALVASYRFGADLQSAKYHFEQLLGRSFTTVLHDEFEAREVRPILEQYLGRPSEKVLDTALAIANNTLPEHPGRLRRLVEVLRLASKIAAKDQAKMSEKHFLEALSALHQLRGSTKERV
jgi:DNA transposition AAA+ family ATPase